MRCGHCKGEHGTVAEVRECSVKGQPDVDVIPEGYYAVKSLTGNNDIDFFEVQKPTEGKWAGWTFVTQIVGGGQHFKQRGQQKWEALRTIAKMGWQESGELFAAETEACYKCNTPLTKYASRTLGIGPECAKKYGRWEEWSTLQRQFDAAAREGKEREAKAAVDNVPKGKGKKKVVRRANA